MIRSRIRHVNRLMVVVLATMRIIHKVIAIIHSTRFQRMRMKSLTAMFTKIKKLCLLATPAKRCAAPNVKINMKAIPRHTSRTSTYTSARTLKMLNKYPTKSYKKLGASTAVEIHSSLKVL